MRTLCLGVGLLCCAFETPCLAGDEIVSSGTLLPHVPLLKLAATSGWTAAKGAVIKAPAG
jgi:hypothetical protein